VTSQVHGTETRVAYTVVDALDLCSVFVLPAVLAAAVEWLLSSVHSDVHFEDRAPDALVQVKHRRQPSLGVSAIRYMSSDSLKRLLLFIRTRLIILSHACPSALYPLATPSPPPITPE
jgi:hypothetical protein